jgi:hypothetical protein
MRLLLDLLGLAFGVLVVGGGISEILRPGTPHDKEPPFVRRHWRSVAAARGVALIGMGVFVLYRLWTNR